MISIRMLAGGCATLLLFCSSAAHAQFDMPQMWVGETAVSSAVFKNGVDQALRSKRRDGRHAAGEAPASLKAASVSFAYKPSLVRRRQNLARFVAKTRAVDPAGAAELEAMFASNDIVAQIGDLMKKAGLQPNNVADAYTLWWVVAWYAVQGRESIAEPATMAAVSRQAADVFVGTGQFRGASDAVKQEMAEALIIQAGLADTANDKMRGDAGQRRALSAAVNKGAKAMGLDLTGMTLTPDGFRLVR